MKLTSIKLCNFRSFYGTTPEILLACGDNSNTTIIHGNNGSGKTSRPLAKVGSRIREKGLSKSKSDL